MKRFALLLCSAVLFPVFPALGQAAPSSQIPEIIVAGLNAYKASGPEAAITAWLKGSPIEGNRDAMTQANQLRTIQDYYGNYRSFDVIATHAISPTSHIVYLVMNFDKGPVFGRFLLYRPDQQWIVASFNFNTNPYEVLPSSLE